MNPNITFHREYLLRLPLPIAQLYGRSYNAKTDRERHDNSFYLFEAWVKLSASTCTAYYLEEVTRGSFPRVAMLDRLLAQLAIPSLGQWLAILRELTKYYATRADAAENPFGKIWGQLNASKRDPSPLLALFRRIKNGPDSPPGGDQSCSLYQVLDAIVQYRNAVFGHGAGRFESFYSQEMGPLLFPALNEMLAVETIASFGPANSQFAFINDLRVVEDGQTEVGLRALTGMQGERLPAIRLQSSQAESLLPNRVCLIWPGRDVPLRLDPMLVFRESDLTEDVLFLNRDRNGKQVEYLSYTTGRTERDRSMQPAMASLLSQVTNRTIGEEDLKHLLEQSLAESVSVESLFANEPVATQELGEYELLSELGRGGMGVVYLARQVSLGRLVALKMLPQDLSSDEVALARFKREIRNLAQCDDPHIIKIISSGVFPDGRPYYTMEYVPGSDLEGVWRELSSSDNQGGTTSSTTLGTQTWIDAAMSASRKQRERVEERSRSGSKSTDSVVPISEPTFASNLPLPPLPQVPNGVDDRGSYVRWVVTLMRDIARALQTVHDRGIIHRDIKPANLLLTSDGMRAVLMDFGLAKEVMSSMAASRQGGLLGTLRYAAPEQLAAANMKIGPTVDVRGLGVTMWELLTRQRLFGASEDEANLTQEVLTSDVPRLRTIDPKFDRDLEAIVARATERRIVDRIQTAGHLADLMQLWLDGKSLPIRPLSITEKAFRWARENAPIAIAGVTVLTLGSIASGLLLRNSFDRKRQAEAVWQQLTEQSNRLTENLFPEFSNLLKQINVPLDTAHLLHDSIEQQTKAIRTIAYTGHLIGASQQKAEDLTKQLEVSASEGGIRLKAVETLVHAQRQRLVINEESYRSADGLPIVFGRGAFPNYRQVISQLSGSQSFQDLDVSTLATKLRSHEITEHLRLAIDDWFSLSYAYDEQPIRQWLAKLANELDSGSEKERRQLTRQAILANDEDAMVKIANSFVESPINDVEPFYTGLMISDGLFENLRLQQAMDVLRHLRKASQNKELNLPVFAARWANHVLGLLLVHVGSQDQLHEAMQCIEAVSAIDPTFETVHATRAQIYHLLGKPEKAFESLERIHLAELQVQKLSIHGLVAADVGRINEAREIAQQLLTQNPDSVLAHAAAATVYARSFDLDAEKDAWQRALRLDPTNPQLITNVFAKADPDFPTSMSKVPPKRLKRFWNAKTIELFADLQQAKKTTDYEAMQRARSQLRVLGVQDWRIDYQEFVSLLGSFELNMDWEQSFQKLRSTAPIGIAESIPNSMLAALANQPSSLDSQVTRGVVLRDIETASAAYPTSRYRRLLAAANLFRFVDRTMAIQFYEGAIRTISSFRELGYGNDAHWKSEEAFLKQSIITLNHPELIEHSDPRGQELLLRTLKNVGTSQYDSKDYVAAEKTFRDLLEFTKSLAEKEPNSLSLQCEVALAYGWLASTKNALGESGVGLAFSDQDVALSESILQNFPDVRESHMNLVRAYEFRYGIFNPLNQFDQKLQATMKTIELLEAILKRWPNDGRAQLRLILSYDVAGGLFSEKEEFETAKSFYEKALPMADKRMASEPNSSMAVSDVVLIQTRLGMAAFHLKDWVEASDRFNAASAISRSYVSTHQEDPVFLRLLADSLNWSSIASWRQSQPEEVLEFLKQEIALRKRLLDFGDSDESNLLVAISSRIDVLKKLGRFDEALMELNDSLRRMDKNPDLFHLRGQIHYEKSEIQLAIEDCTRAIELDGNQAKYFRSRAEVYSWDEKFDAAEKDYSRAIELEPGAEENWLARANFLSSRGRWSEAVQDFERWLKFSPKDGLVLKMAGAAYFRSGNISRSKELLQTAIEIDPQDGMAHRNLGKAFVFEKNWELASQHYEKSMLHNGPFPQAWNEALLVAVKYEGKNREDIFEEMVFHFTNEPNDTNAKAVVWAGVRFPLSTSAEKQLRQWNTKWSAAIKENPLDLRVRGALALRLGDYHSAESQLRDWLDIDANKEDSLARLLLVIALTKQSSFEEASALLTATKKRIELKANEEKGANSNSSAWLDEIETSILLEEAGEISKE